MDPDSSRTRTPPPPARAPEPLVLTLTIASHPELARVGEMAVHEGPKELVLSREKPDFRPAGTAWGRGLEDPHLSRKPLFLRSTRQGWSIDVSSTRTRVVVDGLRVSRAVGVSAARMAHGVVVELADRITLVLRYGPRVSSTETYGLVGLSPGLVAVRSHIARLADVDIPVLIRGESGTGKELVAQALHDFGLRQGQPWFAVNMATLPPALAAGELFGSTRGAFTGATSDRPGYFRAARGGTLFLDEIGECNLELQALLLRVLETKEITPLGEHRPETVDVRVIAATDSALEQRVAGGQFKAPLLHRLAAYEIRVPTLAERREDVGRLFVHFAGKEADADRSSRTPPSCAPRCDGVGSGIAHGAPDPTRLAWQRPGVEQPGSAAGDRTPGRDSTEPRRSANESVRRR